MSYDYLKLWEPIKINKMRLRNRIMLSAMGTFTPMQDGTDSEEGIRYYEERAKGGVLDMRSRTDYDRCNVPVRKNRTGWSDTESLQYTCNSESNSNGRKST